MKTTLNTMAFAILLIPYISSAAPKGLSDSEQVVYQAVTYWYENYRNKEHSYTWVENSEFITPTVKKRLRSKISEYREIEKGTFFNLNITDIQFPEEGFAYIEIIEADPFYQLKYVHVLEKEKKWKVIDSYDLASGLIESIETTFDWEKYYKDLKEERSNQAVERNE